MTTIAWSIENLDYINDSDKIVSRAHWRCRGEEEVLGTLFTIDEIGAVALDEIKADASGFIAYSDLTESKCLEWVHSKLDKTEVEAGIKDNISKQSNPPIKSGKPW